MTLPLVGFDTETTGRDPQTDRIVSAAIVDQSPVTAINVDVLINPGVVIPAEATAVHGITTARAVADGSPAPVGILFTIANLYKAWDAGCAVVGHNVVYDLTILDRESRRHLDVPLQIAGPVVDTLVVDKHMDTYRRGKRTLIATCEHYGVQLSEDDAHGAAADAMAALQLAERMLRGWSKSDLDQLHEDQIRWHSDQQASYARWARSKGVTAVQDSGWPVRDAA